MNYKVIKSERKTMSLSINDALVPVVRAPYFVSDKQIESFVNKNTKWIISATEKKKKQIQKFNLTDEQIEQLVDKAKQLIPEKVEYYSHLMNLYPIGIKITKAKKRFGSCSSKNFLCFSCFLINYPEAAIDYVIVHELAHIKHHNHSKEFYEMIAAYMPDYKEREKLLKS